MKQKQQIRLLILLIVMGGVYTYIQYLFIPQWGVLQQTSSEFNDTQAYLQRLEESYQNHAALQDQVKKLLQQESELKTSLPSRLDKPDIMMNIYNLAKSNGLSPQNLSFEPIKDEGDYLTMGMNFTCTGPLEQVFTLIEQFRQGKEYVFTLDTISWGEGEGEAEYFVNMRLVAHEYK